MNSIRPAGVETPGVAGCRQIHKLRPGLKGYIRWVDLASRRRSRRRRSISPQMSRAGRPRNNLPVDGGIMAA